MLDYDWDKSVGHWVCSTSHAIRKLLGTYLSQEKITLRQFEVLQTLSNNPACGSQSELAEHLGIEPHTLAGVLKRMERDGLLERTACNQDRRKNKVQPTPKADELWKRTTAILHGIRSEMSSGLSQEETDSLKAILAKLRVNIDEAESAFHTMTIPASQGINASHFTVASTPAIRS
ncbi:MarR family winged helix-turn-helix transcriptional regulator [Planctomicrobium sp. SH668]|uniref:MarR family winged helix-turn-helix transcriptional regulator n=1 Tax=Planctomicrobium sp. SH668 TaxID=3448126 RepID=UPI003F5C0136